jgi:hypothetical protein
MGTPIVTFKWRLIGRWKEAKGNPLLPPILLQRGHAGLEIVLTVVESIV